MGIQEAGYGSFNIQIDLFFRAPKGSNLEKARVEYQLDLQPFKRPDEEDYQKVTSNRRLERMQFPTRDEEFKRRLQKGGAKLVEKHRVRDDGGEKKEKREKEKEGENKDRDRDREREKTKEKERPKPATDEMKSKSSKPKSEFTDLFGTPVIKKSNDKKDDRDEKREKEKKKEGSNSKEP